MHELPITEHIIKMATEECNNAGGQKVTAINLVCGDYCGYVPESINMYFEIIGKDTVCENAAINITRIEPKMRCPKCDELFKRRPLSFACPKCGADGETTDIGKEFYIDSIEVE